MVERTLVKSYKAKIMIRKLFIYIISALMGLIFIIPLIWMLSASLKESQQIFTYPIEWLPDPVVLRNYLEAWNAIPFARYMVNTLIIVALGLLGDLVSSSLVGYSFARLHYPGRSILFILCLSTVMIPFTATIIPQFLLFKFFGFIDTWVPLILPSWLAYPFWVFLMRQFYMTIPLELDAAAKIDGCNYFQIYSRILLPLTKPALATIAIFAFVGHWKRFLQPLIYLNTQKKFTIALGLNLFQGLYDMNWELMMAAATIAMLPCIIVFFVAQKYFMQGVVVSASKG